MGFILKTLNKQHQFNLINIKGGTVANSIPDYCNACISIAVSQCDSFIKSALLLIKLVKKQYANERNLKFDIRHVAKSSKVIHTNQTKAILSFIDKTFDGLKSFNKKLDFPESSSNFGVIDTQRDLVMKLNLRDLKMI
jgi:hypothetical protein